jgi:hypothetical protein
MRIPFLIALLILAMAATSQSIDTIRYSPFKQYLPQTQLDSFNLKKLEINKKGMYVLTSWGLGNLIYGSIATGLTHGEAQAFHASNTIWGTVNAVIGATGVLSSYQKKKAVNLSFGETALQQHGQEKLYLINGGLDVAYIAVGAVAWGFSDRVAKQKTRNILSGGGKSFIMQGGGLLLFDWGMYIAHSQHAFRQLNRYIAGLSWTGDGIGYDLMF